MSAFYVGQRVRIIRTVYWPQLMGCEATVISELHLANHPEFGEWHGYDLDVDGYGPQVPSGQKLCAPPDAITPILPTLTAEEILAAEGLPEWSCPLKVAA